jgi:hypothetical protein
MTEQIEKEICEECGSENIQVTLICSATFNPNKELDFTLQDLLDGSEAGGFKCLDCGSEYAWS